jgi:drug/metabolite transporter (DMT)-like permease
LLALSRDPGSGAGTDAPWWGYALLLAAVACEAAYVVLGKRLSRKLSAKRIGALINLWGLMLVAPLALWQASRFGFAEPAATDWALLVFYALAASVVSVWLWMKGLEGMPANRAGVFAVFLPLGSAGVGIFWLGESAGWLHAVALAFALAGVWLATRPD